jgi:hypothetical protein
MRFRTIGWKLFLATAALIGLFLPAFAQEPAPAATTAPVSPLPAQAVIRLRSEPTGALVMLMGEHQWKGTTPFDVARGISGRYEVTAELAGYERWRRSIVITDGESRELSIRLSPKTSLKAGTRSLLIPGWGQFYSDRPTKGALFLLATAVAGGGFIWSNQIYQDRLADTRDAHAAYLRETQVDELPRLYDEQLAAQRRADRAYRRQWGFAVATIGVYSINVLDAVVLFPGQSQGTYASVSPWGMEGPRLSLGTGDGAEVVFRIDFADMIGGSR